MATRRCVSEQTKRAVAAEDGWRCRHCGCTLPATYQIDHIVPLWAEGQNDPANLQPLCPNCHAAKTSDEHQMRRVYLANVSALTRESERACWHCGRVYSKYFSHGNCAPAGAFNQYYSEPSQTRDVAAKKKILRLGAGHR